MEQEKMEVETERAGLNTTLELSENAVEQLKTEIQYLSKEKTDVTDQLNSVSPLRNRIQAALTGTASTTSTMLSIALITALKNP